MPSTTLQPPTVTDVSNCQPTVPSIDFANLSLSRTSKYEVANKTPHFRQFVRYNNAKFLIVTPPFEADQLTLRMNDNETDIAALVPIDPWLRKQLNLLEKFVQQNVTIPSPQACMPISSLLYKPLWPHSQMCISLSRWCNVFQMNVATGCYEAVDIHQVKFGHGKYSVTIEVPYIYIGPHKNGETFSLTMRVVQIVYEPAIESVMTIPFKSPDVKARKKRKTVTVDTQPTVSISSHA